MYPLLNDVAEGYASPLRKMRRASGDLAQQWESRGASERAERLIGCASRCNELDVLFAHLLHTLDTM